MRRPRRISAPAGAQFFVIRLSSIAADVPLAFDVYVATREQPKLLRRAGEILPDERVRGLARRGLTTLLVPEEHRPLYLAALRLGGQDPDNEATLRSRFIKESALLHVHDLFTKAEIGNVVKDTRGLVEDMVAFVSGDVGTTASLMRLSAHDYYTYNHCVNVGVYSIVLARRIFGDDKAVLLAAGLGGLLHDLGKRRIDWSVINKSGPLTQAEWEEIKRHPAYGKEALQDVSTVPEEARRVVYEHHENFNGKGYPRGLKGDEISMLARVVAIADVFDALTTDRSYHKSMQPADALAKMFRMQPGKFDPTVFKLFTRNFDGAPPLELADDFDPCDAQAVLRALGQKR